MATKENTTVIKRPGDTSKIYCQEDYAQEMYDKMFGTEVVQKDISVGDILRVSKFRIVSKEKKEVEAMCFNHTSMFFNFTKERKYFDILNLDEERFYNWVESGQDVEYLKEHKIHIQVENISAAKGSLHGAHLRTIAKEFRDQIGKPTSAYAAKVVSKNQGGFIVDVQGVKAFLPGSLAAANKITDFENFIGKEINVMIEDYLKTSNVFVVSYKKYLEHILPSKLGELERNQIMNGSVTGTSKFGVFIEFEDIFSGLLHTAEMDAETLEKFNEGAFKSGQKIEVWLKDIRENRLILTTIDPAIKQGAMEDFREKIEGNTKEATIVSIKPHGALMEIEKGILGLLPVKEMKKTGKRLSVGETLEVFIKKVDTSTGKIYLTMNDERIATEV